MTRPTCTECGAQPATSHSTLRCEVCLYAEVAGRERADAQVQAAERTKQARKRKAKVKP